MSSQADEVDPDHIQADRQLHQTLESACGRRYGTVHGSRKHSRTANIHYDTDDYSEDYPSDVSGRFDDADEEYAAAGLPTSSPRSTHSMKRRRSSDWPVDESLPPRKETGSMTSRWPFHSRNNSSTHGSPRTASGRHGRLAGPNGRGRRSRFIEGMMNDSVSEKPPSIFLRDGKSGNDTSGHVGPTHRHSGIFRFGKAIASAFNPFGGWGNVSEMWKGPSAEASKQPVDDDIARVEKAYAELKKAGYRGAVKGKYMAAAGSQSSNNLTDQTWKSIHETMNYKPTTGRHSRQNSGDGHESSGSLRSSFQEVRRARSSLGIASSLIPHVSRRSEDTDRPGELRKQRSKREKLLRRVSTLEEKLEKARRELQEFMGDEAPQVLERSQCQDPTHQRKFIPGTLPTLPSERLLYDNDTGSPVSPTSGPAPQRSIVERVERAMQTEEPEKMITTAEEPESTVKTPAKSPRQPAAQSLTVDSPSLKRKSPDPESASAANTPKSREGTTNPTGEGNQSNSSRKAKLPKMVRDDSPGSVERKQSRHPDETHTRRSPSEERGRRRRSSQPLRSASKRSPSARRRASNSRNRGPARSLRMRKGRADLRSASAQAMDADDPDKENQYATQHRQEQQESGSSSNPNQTAPSPRSPPAKRKDQRYTYNYIPPVPPLPKDLAITAAKTDRRLAKEMERQAVRNRKSKTQAPSGNIQKDATAPEGFKWREEFF